MTEGSINMCLAEKLFRTEKRCSLCNRMLEYEIYGQPEVKKIRLLCPEKKIGHDDSLYPFSDFGF